MRYTVKEEFRTPLNHFRPEMEIGDDDIDGVLGCNDWVRLGKIEPLPNGSDGASAAKARAPRKARAAKTAAAEPVAQEQPAEPQSEAPEEAPPAA